MDASAFALAGHFAALEDPRTARTKRHPVLGSIVIAAVRSDLRRRVAERHCRVRGSPGRVVCELPGPAPRSSVARYLQPGLQRLGSGAVPGGWCASTKIDTWNS